MSTQETEIFDFDPGLTCLDRPNYYHPFIDSLGLTKITTSILHGLPDDPDFARITPARLIETTLWKGELEEIRRIGKTRSDEIYDRLYERNYLQTSLSWHLMQAGILETA